MPAHSYAFQRRDGGGRSQSARPLALRTDKSGLDFGVIMLTDGRQITDVKGSE